MPNEKKAKTNPATFSKQPSEEQDTVVSTMRVWVLKFILWCQYWHQLQLRSCPAFLRNDPIWKTWLTTDSVETDMIYSMPKAIISSEHLHVFLFSSDVSFSILPQF